MVNQPECDIDVVAEASEHKASRCKNVRVVRTDQKGPPSKIDAGAAVRFRVFGRATYGQQKMTMGRQGESWAVTRIALNRFLKQVECLKDTPLVV